MSKHFLRNAIAASAGVFSGLTFAASVQINIVDDHGVVADAGTITYEATPYGVLFTPALTGLPSGIHGFHMHENPSCAPKEQNGKMVPALAAGGHFDPSKTGKHLGPWGEGHLGDLPALYVDASGRATYPVLAPRLRMADLPGHSLMIHLGGDNYDDHPAALGGGGARVACGVLN